MLTDGKLEDTSKCPSVKLGMMALAFLYVLKTLGLLYRLTLASPWVYGQEYCTIPSFYREDALAHGY